MFLKPKVIDLNKIDAEQRKLIISCLRKFFFKKLPQMRIISMEAKARAIFKNLTVNDLGIEGTFETIIELFELGYLHLSINSEDDFVVYRLDHNGHIGLVYDSRDV